MAGLTVRGLDLILDSGFQPPWISLHVGDPGEDGSQEVRGGNPSYERRAAAWSSASQGTRSISVEIVFDIPQNTEPTHVGYWSSRTGGVFYGSRPLSAPERFSNQGTLTFPAGSITEVLS